VDEWMDGWMDGWTEGWKEHLKGLHISYKIFDFNTLLIRRDAKFLILIQNISKTDRVDYTGTYRDKYVGMLTYYKVLHK
jgi:hypothetical protein